MRKIFLLILIFCVVNSYAYIPSQSEVRLLYHEAATKEASCKKLITVLQSFDESNNPLFAGYKACATMMMANYFFNPFSKLSNFYKGKKLLEKAIEIDKENIELRFLRFSVQTNIPSFLGYKSSIAQDKSLLIKSVTTLKDLQLKQLILSFLISSDHLTLIEKQKLKS